MDQEIVFLESIGACDVEELPSKVPADTARYLLPEVSSPSLYQVSPVPVQALA